MSAENMMDLIRSRRTVRKYDERPVERSALDALADAARWAPSGLNNQPWRFVTVEGRETLDALADCTKYGAILRGAPAAIAVFLDTSSLYHREKDIQGVGAAIENLLLAAHAMGLGACWLGEILNQREKVESVLGVDGTLELMAVVTVGHPQPGKSSGTKERHPLDELIVGRF